MNQSITIPSSSFEALVSRISRLEKLVETVLEKMEKEPEYGTSAWWNYSEKRADAEIKTGKYKTFQSGKEYLKYLKTL